MSQHTLCWEIKQTWDGVPIPDAERAHVWLQLSATGDLTITIDAPFHADPSPPTPPGQTPKLWEHEVVEVFIAGDAAHYTEVELGPHGHFLALRLRGCRQPYDWPALKGYEAQIDAALGRWRGRAVLDAAHLPSGAWRGNAYALHGEGTRRRYLAAHPVPGAQPDFHQLARFVPLSLGPSPR
jgi:hypothetical protein